MTFIVLITSTRAYWITFETGLSILILRFYELHLTTMSDIVNECPLTKHYGKINSLSPSSSYSGELHAGAPRRWWRFDQMASQVQSVNAIEELVWTCQINLTGDHQAMIARESGIVFWSKIWQV